MISFLQYLEEKTIHYFDKDDTLVHPNDRIHVKDKKGNRTATLTTKEFANYKLPKGQSYDFSDLRKADKYHARPIKPMVSKLNALQRKGKKVEILTARMDFDDQPKFAQKMKNIGVDISKVHVRRAGNVADKLNISPAQAKAKMVSDSIKKNKYKVVHLYDDSIDNLKAFLALKEKHPKVKFYAHHVQHTNKGIKLTRHKA